MRMNHHTTRSSIVTESVHGQRRTHREEAQRRPHHITAPANYQCVQATSGRGLDDSPVAFSTWIRRLSTSRTLEPVSDKMPTSWMPFCFASFTLAL